MVLCFGGQLVDERLLLGLGRRRYVAVVQRALAGQVRARKESNRAVVELDVVETEPGFKGDTSSNTTKPATLQTGLTVNVPLFVEVGDKLKVDTRTGDYVERVVRNFVKQREQGERFATWALRADDADLR